MNELQISVELNAGSIISNTEELKQQLAAKMTEYKNAVFTAESKDILKKEMAALRKLRESVEKRRKEVKEQCMAPYLDFEKEAKQLVAIIDEPIMMMDKQLKEMEEIRIRDKRAEIRQIYDEIVIDEAKEYLPLDEIYDKKWDNAGTSIKKIKEALEDLVVKVSNEILIIRQSGSDVSDEAIEIYKRDRDLTKALTHINTYEANKKKALELEQERRRKEEERARQAELERIRAEERAAVAREEEIRQEAKREAAKNALQDAPDVPEDSFEDDELPFAQPSTITAFYKVIATSQELEQVEMAFNSIGIYFERRDA